MGNGNENVVELSEDDAEREYQLSSKYFSVASNTKYTMTFGAEAEDQDSPDGKAKTGRLLELSVPVFDKQGHKTGETKKAIVRQMVITSLDGEPCLKIWKIQSKKMNGLFRTYTENNMLLSKKFLVEIKGERMNGDYRVVALDKSTPKE